MIRSWLLFGVLITSVSLFSLIFITRELRHLDETQNILVQLPVVDEGIYFSMMMLHSSITHNFDSLTELNNRHIEISTQLFDKLENHFQGKYEKTLLDLKSIQQLKEKQLERFKSNIALLNNAKIYVTTKIQILSTNEEQQLPTILKISSNLLKFSESPNNNAANQIRQDIETVDTEQLSQKSKVHWQHALMHMEYYLKNKIDVLNFSLLTSNWATLPPYKTLKNQIHDYHERFSLFQNMVYSTLTLGIISLASLAAFMFKRYLKARHDLVTLNKHLEARIEAATHDLEESRDVAVKANAAKTSFLANMSHELRTPLNSIIGFSSRLEKKLEGSAEKSSLFALKNIRANGHYLLNFFNDLFELSKASQEEGADVKTNNIEINELCRSAIANVSSYFHQKPIEVEFKLKEEVIIHSQENCIKRIIYGVINTAMHNTDSGTVTLNIEPQEGGCSFIVSDSGASLSEERIKVLLNPFEHEESSNINVEGIGLGLYLVAKMLDVIKGSIEINSRENGNEYRIFLPSQLY